MLSARASETDKVRALEAGAVDYLVKPFGSAELLARARVHLWRHQQAAGGDDALLSFGDVALDRAPRRVTRAGKVVHLTPIEYRLLALLTARPDPVLTLWATASCCRNCVGRVMPTMRTICAYTWATCATKSSMIRRAQDGWSRRSVSAIGLYLKTADQGEFR